VTIRGKLAGRAVSFDVPVVLPEARDRPAIAAIWARGKIAELTRQQLRAEQPAIKQKIIELALGNHLMSRYTAFVAVDASRVTAGGAPQRVAVPVEVPAGLHSTQGNYGGSGGGAIYGVPAGVVSGVIAQPGAGVIGGKLEALRVAGGDDGSGEAAGVADGAGRITVAAPPPPPLLPPPPRVEPPSLSPPPPPRQLPEMKPSEHRGKAPGPAAAPDTPEAAMRADIDRCWAARGTIRVAIDFEPGGTSSTVAVTGADAAVTDCVRGVAKKWRSLARKHLELAITK
jgi:hypothetical protein